MPPSDDPEFRRLWASRGQPRQLRWINFEFPWRVFRKAPGSQTPWKPRAGRSRLLINDLALLCMRWRRGLERRFCLAYWATGLRVSFDSAVGARCSAVTCGS